MREQMRVWTARRREPRPLRAHLARTLIPRTVAFAAIAASLLVGQIMAVDPIATAWDADRPGVPTWTAADAEAHPGCVAAAAWPAGAVADAVLAHSFFDDATERLPFDLAWELNHNQSESDDVWVIGVCPG